MHKFWCHMRILLLYPGTVPGYTVLKNESERKCGGAGMYRIFMCTRVYTRCKKHLCIHRRTHVFHIGMLYVHGILKMQCENPTRVCRRASCATQSSDPGG